PTAGSRCSSWGRSWAYPAAGEVEFTDACMPVETAVDGFILVHVPEACAIGRIDGSHTIIAPAAVGIGLAPGAGEHCVFPLTEVVQRVAGKTPGITNAWENARAGYGIADGRVSILIHGYAGHEAP